MAHTRFVAVGDSFTEGLQDGPDPQGVFRGWADRLAAALAGRDPGTTYANLAVRGKLLGEVVADQLPVALALGPDLLSFHAGGNDVLRPGADLDAVLCDYDDAVAHAVAGAGTVVLFTVLERSGDSGGRMAEGLAARIAGWNDGVRDVATRHGAVLVDTARVPVLTDRRLWHSDRLHLSPAGHARVAGAVCAALGVDDGTPHAPGWWAAPLPPTPRTTPVGRLLDDAGWAFGHLLPWALRRLRGVSSGDGRAAKRPDLLPLA